ncbi:hypothetical protein AWQ21_03945 [Picosynechococcus sp. PCC 7003]|uniref:Uma2 family endonuclease n=1 Tax=Picosynechococcus sp. PCC 7003 TaxID=374981 RepID=UPI0008106F6B|nr:Uma2 family endonuclease [Picosynechococcus sp. PCC 7003]ANV83604.1 hypothetical protein AWQ21_03945 [Picosynechococcus sp. PCC 7003]
MVQALSRSITLEEFLARPETKPANEYIDGIIRQKPMPQGKHSLLQRELTFALTMAFRADKAAQVFPELRCTFGACSIVADIAVFKTERIPRDDNGEIANVFKLDPDWSIEILSPNQSHTRVIRNILHCLDYGAEMSWLIDPQEACIFVYQADKSVQVFDQQAQNLPTPAFAQSLTLSGDKIFAWLKN